jgi:hypothetical protein
MPRRARLLAFAFAIAFACAPATARAKWALQGVAVANAGWTDNVLSVPSNPPPGTAGPQADFFFDLRPSLVFTAGSPRFITRLAYTFDANLYATHSEADSYSNRLDWTGFILPSRTTELLIALSAREGRLNTFNLAEGSAATPIQVTPIGGTTYVGGSAQELFSWDITPQWRFVQSLGFNAYLPLDPRLSPNTFEVDTHYITERAFRHDAFGVDLRLDYSIFTEVRGPVLGPDGTTTADGVVTPAQSQLILAPVAKWRHDYGHFWNSELDAGVIVVFPLSQTGSPIVQPAGLAAIRYLHPYGQADLSYAHTVQPNALAAQTFALDQLTLRGSVPFGQKSHVALSAAAGYQHGRVIDFGTGGTLSNVDLIVVDATLTWAPRAEFNIFARYQYFNQIGHEGDFTPEPSFARNTVMIGVTGTYPGAPAAVVPTREALRVDRSDAVTIPEPHSEPAKY